MHTYFLPLIAVNASTNSDAGIKRNSTKKKEKKQETTKLNILQWGEWRTSIRALPTLQAGKKSISIILL